MATTYTHIAENKRKTALLIIAYVVIIVLVVYALQRAYGYDIGFVVMAGAVSIGMSMVSYFVGDKVALFTSGAQPVTKETNSYVVNMVENLSITAGLPMPKVYVIQDQAINAFATGRDPKHASVAVTTGAIEKLENEELEGVLAHELSHVGNYDILVMTIVIVMVGIVSILTDWTWRGSFYRRSSGDNNRGNSNGILLIIGIVLIILAPIISELIKMAVSRKREFLADASGALLTRYPEGLARALEKISLQNKPMASANSATAHLFISNPFKAKGFSSLFSTHPPIEERIKRLRAM